MDSRPEDPELATETEPAGTAREGAGAAREGAGVREPATPPIDEDVAGSVNAAVHDADE